MQTNRVRREASLKFLVSHICALFTEIDPQTQQIEAKVDYFTPVEIGARNEVLASLSGLLRA